MRITDLAEQFVAYLQRETGLTVAATEVPSTRLPQYLRAQFAVQVFDIAGRRCIALLQQAEAEFASAQALLRQIDKTLELSGEPEAEYCLVAAELSHYLRRRLMQAGTPFVVVDQQIYLPFLGTLMTRRRRAPPPAGDALGQVPSSRGAEGDVAIQCPSCAATERLRRARNTGTT